MTVMLSPKDQWLEDFDSMVAGRRTVKLVDSVPVDANGYECRLGQTVYHRISADGFFFSNGRLWIRHSLNRHCWDITKIGCDLPASKKNRIPMMEVRIKTAYKPQATEYYRPGSKYVGD